MTEQEYRDCAARISQAFPELTEWFRALPDEATKATQREARHECLIGLQADDVMRAVSLLLTEPKLPWHGFGLLGRGFAMIADRAREVAGRRFERVNVERLCDAARRRGQSIAGEVRSSELVTELLEARKAGECQTAAATREWFADRIGESEDMRDAVRCTVCGDTGRVQCLVKVQRNKGGSWAKWFGVASCPCEAGEPLRRYPAEAARVPQFDDCEHIRVIPGATDEDLRAEVRRVMERRDSKKRIPALDQYNQRMAAQAREQQREPEFV